MLPAQHVTQTFACVPGEKTVATPLVRCSRQMRSTATAATSAACARPVRGRRRLCVLVCSQHKPSYNTITTHSPAAGVTRAAPCPALPPPAPASWRSPRSKQGSQGGPCSAQSALQSSGLAGLGGSAAMLADACSQLMHSETRQARSAFVAQPAQKQWHLQTPLARARCQRLAQ